MPRLPWSQPKLRPSPHSGADNGGESGLTYAWAVIGAPPAPVTFSTNGTNAAKNTTATFTEAGSYTLQVTITNAANLSVTSTVNVQVNQTLTSVVVAPLSASVAANASMQFTATALDQFGNPMTTQPPFTWSTTNGAVNGTGLYSAPRTSGTGTVTATTGALSGTGSVNIFYDALAWYAANAASGTTLVESSTVNQTATLTGAAAFGAGVSGNALALTGGNANLPNGIVSSLNDFTIAAWVNPSALASWARIFDFGTGTTNYMFLTVNAGGNGDLRFAILDPAVGAEQQINGLAIPLNTWTHIAVTLAGNVATLYVNGVAVANNTTTTIHPTNLGYTTQNYLGKSQFAADPAFNGSIDDFRIYSTALSAQQVLQLAAPPSSPAPSPPRVPSSPPPPVSASSAATSPPANPPSPTPGPPSARRPPPSPSASTAPTPPKTPPPPSPARAPTPSKSPSPTHSPPPPPSAPSSLP